MISIERTAYPRLEERVAIDELFHLYTPSEQDLEFTKLHVKKKANYQSFLVLFKSFRKLGYFPNLSEVPSVITEHIGKALGLEYFPILSLDNKTLKLYQKLIREYIGVKEYDGESNRLLTLTITENIHYRNDPVDLINIGIEELISNYYELPPFDLVRDLVNNIRQASHSGIFAKIFKRLSDHHKEQILKLIEVSDDSGHSLFNRIKKYAPNASVSHLKDWLEHLEWIQRFGDFSYALDNIPEQKLIYFAEEAKVFDSGEMQSKTSEETISLIVCLIWKRLREVRDEIVEMFIRLNNTLDAVSRHRSPF